jgi:hypothetical protein
MAEGSMTALRLLFALALIAALPSSAFAQDATDAQSGDQTEDQAQPAPGGDQAGDDQSGDHQTGDDQSPQSDQAAAPEPVDPAAVLQGLWHVDRADGSAANDTMVGGILKVDRQAVTSLSGGTCASPGFAAAPAAAGPKQIGLDITCLGQILASARWSNDDPDTVEWREPNLDVVLHRVKSATTAQQPAADSSGDGDAQ